MRSFIHSGQTHPHFVRSLTFQLILCITASLLTSCKPELANSQPEDEPDQALDSKETQDQSPSVAITENTLSAGQGEESPQTEKLQSSLYGLLVAPLAGAQNAGEASKMNATVLSEERTTSLKILFNQKVGATMDSALGEVMKFLQLRHDAAALAKSIEISFEEQYSSKDGPSAAVACALLAESIITGVDLDTRFAVTGDLNADGAVQPVGGIDGKVRGAINGGCAIVAVPHQSSNVLSDFAVAGQLKTFIDIQIFSITTFDSALALAKVEGLRDAKVQESIDTFSDVQRVLQQPDGEKWLTNPHVHERLRSVLKNTPNHESAKYLLLSGLGRAPDSFSLSGSFLQIYRATSALREALDTGVIPNDTSEISQSMFDLRRVRSQLDARTRGCADALEDFSAVLKKVGDTSLENAQSRIPRIVDELNESWDLVLREYRKIENDPVIREELGL